jgi:hypothetical protein
MKTETDRTPEKVEDSYAARIARRRYGPHATSVGHDRRLAAWSAAALAAVAATAAAALAPAAWAFDRPALLNGVARVYSLGVGEVRCPSQAEWVADPHRASFSWGYTNLREDYTVLPPLICIGAVNVGTSSIPAWQQAAGVWMLVHEAFHLRRWRFRRNEAKVSCQTIVYFTDAAGRLGASEAQAQQLYPYALALYALELDLYPWRRDRKCIVPRWIPPSESMARLSSQQERAMELAGLEPATSWVR